MSGVRAWLLQRLSAVYMIAFVVFVTAHFAADPPRSYETWRAWVMHPGMNAATLVFFIALLLHAWVGIRDVVMDYLHPASARIPVLALVGFGLLAMGIRVARILLLPA